MRKARYTLMPASEDNKEQIISYKKQSIFENGGEISEKERQRISDYVERRVPEQLEKYKIILVDGKVVGCVLILKKISGMIYIDEIYIEPEYRNRKIGSSIIKKVLKKEKNVCLWVYKTNEKAILLYKRLKFKVKNFDGARYYMEVKK